MAKFTREIRRKIVEEFTAANGGEFHAEAFMKYVQATGESHPAWAWFTWDDKEAAEQLRIDQARAFIRDLRIKVELSTMGPGRAINIRTTEMPLAISPTADRANGGGYVITNPESPVSRRLLCQEAASALRSFFKRYEAAVFIAGIPQATADDLVARLEDAGGEIEGKVVRVAEG